jgi:hypothetical protein
MADSYQCPVCHRPLFSPAEVCDGAFTERDHPTGVNAVAVASPPLEHGEGTALVAAGQVFAASVERDRREPDKLLCHLQTFKRALADVSSEHGKDGA